MKQFKKKQHKNTKYIIPKSNPKLKENIYTYMDLDLYISARCRVVIQ